MSQIHFRFYRTQTLGAWEWRLHGAAPGGPLATPERVEGAGPRRRSLGGQVKPGLLSVSLGVDAWCAVVAAHQSAPTDLALLFAQISRRWPGLQDQIVLETRSAPQVRPAQRSGMAQGALSTPSLRWPTVLRGIGGAWKWADLRSFRLIGGLSRIPNTALPCLDPFSSPFRAQARLCSWPGATCARARGWQGGFFFARRSPLVLQQPWCPSSWDAESAQRRPPTRFFVVLAAVLFGACRVGWEQGWVAGWARELGQAGTQLRS